MDEVREANAEGCCRDGHGRRCAAFNLSICFPRLGRSAVVLRVSHGRLHLHDSSLPRKFRPGGDEPRASVLLTGFERSR